MLSGTFELFPLSEVLGLIERAQASGALVVRGREVDGTLYFAAGQMCGGEVADLAGPVEEQAGLETRLLEVCVALLRSRAAEFEFRPDVTPAWPAPIMVPIGAVFDRAREIARDWSAIMTAVESFESILERTGRITTDSITLSHLAFRVLELVDGQTTIRELARNAGASLITVGPEVRSLVVAGAVRVIVGADRALATARAEVESDRIPVGEALDVTTEPGVGPTSPTPPPAYSALQLEEFSKASERAELAEKAGIADPGPARAPDPGPEPAEDAPAPPRAEIVVDRSELLRMFSGLKDE